MMGHLSDFLDLLKGTNVDDSIRGKYEGVARKKILFMVLLIVALVVVSIGVLGVGGVMVDFGNVFRVLFHPIFPDHVSAPDQLYYYAIINDYRMPRVLLGILTGMCLAVAGASMQGIISSLLKSS